MGELGWALALPALVGLTLSFAIERLLQPAPSLPWRLPPSAFCVHVGLWLFVYGLELALCRRPIFAMCNVLALQTLLVFISRIKFKVLGEPFVYPDFEYFLDALRHPRLYIPFFGGTNAIAGVSVFLVALWVGLAYETSLTAPGGLWTQALGDSAVQGFTGLLVASAFVSFIGWLIAAIGAQRPQVRNVSFDANQDLESLGLSASLWSYCHHEQRSWRDGKYRSSDRIASPFDAGLTVDKPGALRHLIVVQSESFFDARRICPGIKPAIFSHYDKVRDQAVRKGRLNVAAWGANTVRTEFAFLSGLAPQSLGVHRFNPYRRYARTPVSTLASYLKTLGYQTVCIHPYPASFYKRDRVFPLMGFDVFLDVQSFMAEDYVGAYVGDAAVAKRVEAWLAGRSPEDPPVFLFVITMENHGPLHWEKVSPADRAALFDSAIPDDCDELVAYVRHLRHADAMLDQLTRMTQNALRPSTLCFYGDHVPIMSKVYARLGAPEAATDYLIWHSNGPSREAVDGDESRHGKPTADPGFVAVEDLALILLDEMGMRPR